jgi:hypothetical protein
VLCRIFACTPSDLWLDLGQIAVEHEPDADARRRLRSVKVVRAGDLL